MSIQTDTWIKKMVKDKKMIKPFEGGMVRNGNVSYGLSSFGYDLRVGFQYKIFTDVHSIIVDPKNFSKKSFVDYKGKECIIPPNSFALTRSIEYFRIPTDVFGLCIGKSTYARCGIIVNVTPLQPGWEGNLVIEISNTTPLPAKIYSGEGIAEIVFFKGDNPPNNDYEKLSGRYSKQKSIVLPKI